MVRMMMTLVGVVIGLIMLIGFASAACQPDISADPHVVTIGVGETNTSTIHIITCGSAYEVGFDVADVSEDDIEGQLCGPCYNGICDYCTDWGIKGNLTGDGYLCIEGCDYILKLGTQDNVELGQHYVTVTLLDISLAGGSINYNLETDVIASNVVPELLTAALVGAGLVAVVLIRRNNL